MAQRFRGYSEGWAKARSAVPTILPNGGTVGTLRFAYPTSLAALQKL